ncbi:hypothetical protein [Oceanithermus sp.]
MTTRVLISLMLATVILAGCRQPPVVVFPNDGAELDNPVYLVASTSVTWFDGNDKLGEGDHWSGFLSEGNHEIRAVASEGTAQLHLWVRQLFPLGVIARVPAGYELPEAPDGEYVRVWGRAEEKSATLMAQERKPSLSLRHRVPVEGHRLSLMESASTQPTAPEVMYEHVADLLKEGRASACGAGCVRQAPGIGLLGITPPAQRVFKVLDLSGYGYDEVAAELVYLGERTLAYIESGETEAVHNEVVELAQVFDGRIQPRVQTAFGSYADVDGNGKVILLFTRRLNASGLAIGFFYPGDLFPASPDLPESNEAEILYLGVPEEGNFNFSPASLAATACHELQHLVNFSHVTLPFASDPNPPLSPVWLNEGLSHLAEDLCGYNTLGGNLAFVARFLERPWEISLTSTGVDGRGDSIERRGAAYLLLRYALEQAGGVQLTPDNELSGGGLAFTRALMSPDALTLDRIAGRATGVEDGARLLWRWWWTMVATGLEQEGVDVTDRYPWAAYAPPVPDPATGDELGVNLFRGEINLGDYAFSLKGLRFKEDCSAIDLPVDAFCAERANGPVVEHAQSTNYRLQVMRVR